MSGIAQRMPRITELIAETLGCESDYRLLSAVAHGHHWATLQFGFSIVELKDKTGQITPAAQKSLNSSFVLYAAHLAVTSFAKVLWYLWQLFGWVRQEIQQLLDNTYESLS